MNTCIVFYSIYNPCGFMLISLIGLIKYCFKIVIYSSTYSFNLNTYHGSSIRILKLQKIFSRFSFEEKLCLEKPTRAGARLHWIAIRYLILSRGPGSRLCSDQFSFGFVSKNFRRQPRGWIFQRQPRGWISSSNSSYSVNFETHFSQKWRIQNKFWEALKLPLQRR